MSSNDLIEQLFNTITQLKNLISQRNYHSHEEKIATTLQFSALNFLKDRTGVTVGELADFLQLSKSSATQLTERLVKMGLIKRLSDRNDRRVIRLSITGRGKTEFINLKTLLKTRMNSILSKIPEKDVKELIRIHTSLIKSLKDEK